MSRSFLQESVTDGPRSPGQTCKTYTLYHSTFRRFVAERLSLDGPALHTRIVQAYLNKKTGSLELENTDTYGLRYLVRHAVWSNDPNVFRTVFSPSFAIHKVKALGSLYSVLDDLSAIIVTEAGAHNFSSALAFAGLNDWYLRSRKRATLGLEWILRLRSGETDIPQEDLPYLASVNDELLLRAEIAIAVGDSDPELARRQIEQALLLVTSCPITSEDTVPQDRTIQPSIVEMTALRIAETEPQAAISIALSIPEPTDLTTFPSNIDPASSARVLFRVFGKIGRKDLSTARQLAAEMKSTPLESYAMFGIAAALLPRDPNAALDVLKKAISTNSTEPERVALSYIVARYLTLQLPQLEVASAAIVLDTIAALTPSIVFDPGFFSIIDTCIAADRPAWNSLATDLPPGTIRDLVRFRTQDDMTNQSLREQDVDTEEFRDLLRADRLINLTTEDTICAAATAAELKTLPAYAVALAALLSRLAEQGRSDAAYLLESIQRSNRPGDASTSFRLAIEMLRAILPSPGTIRERVLRWTLSIIHEINLDILQIDASLEFRSLLAHALAEAPDKPAFFSQLVHEAAKTESERLWVARGILQELPIDVCEQIAEDPASFQLIDSTPAACQACNTTLFDRESVAYLLSALARRLSHVTPSKSRNLILTASKICALTTDADDRGRQEGG